MLDNLCFLLLSPCCHPIQPQLLSPFLPRLYFPPVFFCTGSDRNQFPFYKSILLGRGQVAYGLSVITTSRSLSSDHALALLPPIPPAPAPAPAPYRYPYSPPPCSFTFAHFICHSAKRVSLREQFATVIECLDIQHRKASFRS